MYEQNDNVGGLQRQQFSWRITMIFPIGNICNYLLCQLLSTSINYVLLMIFLLRAGKPSTGLHLDVTKDGKLIQVILKGLKKASPQCKLTPHYFFPLLRN